MAAPGGSPAPYAHLPDMGESMLPLLDRAVSLFAEGAVARGLVAASAGPGVLEEMRKQATAPGVNRSAMALSILDRAAAVYGEVGDDAALANVLKTRGLVDSLIGRYKEARVSFEQATEKCEALFGAQSPVTCDT
ncbi:unnamed protein product, partial [Symbiodinium sp. KB8]